MTGTQRQTMRTLDPPRTLMIIPAPSGILYIILVQIVTKYCSATRAYRYPLWYIVGTLINSTSSTWFSKKLINHRPPALDGFCPTCNTVTSTITSTTQAFTSTVTHPLPNMQYRNEHYHQYHSCIHLNCHPPSGFS